MSSANAKLFISRGQIMRNYPRQGERVNSLNSSGLSQQTLPRVDLADRNVESSSNIFHGFIALRDDADTLGNGFGCDRMVSSNHDNLKCKQSAIKALPVLQSNAAKKAETLTLKRPHVFCSTREPEHRASLRYRLPVCEGLRWMDDKKLFMLS